MQEPIDGNQIVRQEFGATQVQASHALSESTMAAQMQARVNARCVMAMRHPRNLMQVRQNILAECRRPRFAAIALFAKPQGREKVIGFSIRFAEAAMRCMGHMDVEAQVIHDDPRKRIVRVTVSDIQNNTHQTAEATIEKVVERRKLRPGQKFIAQRVNSYGDTVYLVEAQEHDLLPKEGAAISKLQRNCILRHLPRDILDEAREEIDNRLVQHAEKNPEDEIRRVCDVFEQVRVSVADLEEYLGCSVSKISPKQVVELRQIYTALREGVSSWSEVMESRNGAEEDQGKLPAGKEAAPSKSKKAARKEAQEQIERQNKEEDVPAEEEMSPENQEYLRQLREAEESENG